MEGGRQKVTILDNYGNEWEIPAIIREDPKAAELVARDKESIGIAVLVSISEGTRASYSWGRKARLAQMKVGEEIEMPYQTRNNYAAWRSIASRASTEFGTLYRTRRDGDKVYIWRQK